MLKALFITHDIGLYGAAKSLQHLLKNYKLITIDLLVPAAIVYDKNNITFLKEKFGGHIRNIVGYNLPCDLCFNGQSERQPLLESIKTKISSWIYKRRIHAFIKKGGYDFIHLNSLVLHYLITEKYPFVIHVREIFDYSNREVFKSLKNVKGVIFIDETTRKPFKDIALRNSIVLNNPVDMTGLGAYSPPELPFCIDYKKKTVFSVIGSLKEFKGADFIIKCFKNVSNGDALLLIVGFVNEEYLEICKKAAGGDKRIIFYGEEADILKMYFASDYIIRGEAYFCIGRTVYEGLYAGCHVIIPGSYLDKDAMFEYERFKGQIHFYTPRDSRALENLLDTLSHKKVYDKTYYSNTADYAEKFHDFILKVV